MFLNNISPAMKTWGQICNYIQLTLYNGYLLFNKIAKSIPFAISYSLKIQKNATGSRSKYLSSWLVQTT